MSLSQCVPPVGTHSSSLAGGEGPFMTGERDPAVDPERQPSGHYMSGKDYTAAPRDIGLAVAAS